MISISAEDHKDNLYLRLEEKEGELKLRISIGGRKFAYAKVKREPSGERDKWNTFLAMLLESFKSEKYIL